MRTRKKTTRAGWPRFWRDERGQGLLLAVACLFVLVAFVALVYNVGRLTQRRTKVQLAADAAAYSGAVVEANSLSTIAWINNAMAQAYYDAVQYAVYENVTGVGALLACKVGNLAEAENLAKEHALASEQKNRAIEWLRELSRIENAVAILSPRLVEEEMFAVARRTFPGRSPEDLPDYEAEPRGPRISTYPSFRLFPLGNDQVRFKIEQLQDLAGNIIGWRIIDIDRGMMLELKLVDDVWYTTYTPQDIETERIIFKENKGPLDPGVKLQWEVRYEQPVGVERQTLIISQTDDLGWVVAGREIKPGGSPAPMPELRFDRVDMDKDGFKEGTKITVTNPGDDPVSYIFANDPFGGLFKWEKDHYERYLQHEMEIAGVNVRLNVSNSIRFPHGSATIGAHPVVHIGPVTITLYNPPKLHCGIGPVHVAVRGFDADTVSVSVRGFTLGPSQADGRWRQHFEAIEEYWWRHRLTELECDDDPSVALRWQYDYQRLGAHLAYEDDMERFVYKHAFGDRLEENFDVETDWPPFIWFNPRPDLGDVGPRVVPKIADPSPTSEHGIQLRQLENPDPNFKFYYLIAEDPCTKCAGKGEVPDPEHEGEYILCPRCHGIIYPDREHTSVGATIQEFKDAHSEIPAVGTVKLPAGYEHPLVLTEEFFKFGLNVGVWHETDRPMLFPESSQADWGFIAVSGARIGINGAFPDAASREDWIAGPDNLYSPDVTARLVASSKQVDQVDLDWGIITGRIVTMRDSPTSYLWDALINASQTHFAHNVWLDKYEGAADRRVGDKLRNMRVRIEGREWRFDISNPALDETVKH